LSLNRSRILKIEEMPDPDPDPDSKLFEQERSRSLKSDSGHLCNGHREG